MDFPLLAPWVCMDPPAALIDGLGKAPAAVMQIEDNYFAVYEREENVRSIRPDFAYSNNFILPGSRSLLRATTPISFPDISRPAMASRKIRSPDRRIAPWRHIGRSDLAKRNLHARQVSERGGELWCEVKGGAGDSQRKCSAYFAGRVAGLDGGGRPSEAIAILRLSGPTPAPPFSGPDACAPDGTIKS